LSLWFAGKYAGNTQAVAEKLTRWLSAKQESDTKASIRFAAPSWEATPTGNNIINALKYAQHAGDMTLIFGGAGVGKT